MTRFDLSSVLHEHQRTGNTGKDRWNRNAGSDFDLDLKINAEKEDKQKQHVEKTPLTQFWEGWNGAVDFDRSYGALDVYLRSR